MVWPVCADSAAAVERGCFSHREGLSSETAADSPSQFVS